MKDKLSRREFLKLSGVTAGLGFTFALTGCDGGGGSASTETASSGDAEGGKKVGFVAVGPEGGWRTANEDDVKTSFKDAGYELTYSPTEKNDQSKQINAFNKFVNDEVDLILLSATEAKGWEDSLEKAKDAEIPVILLDRGIEPNDTDLYTSHIGPSNVWCGEQAAEFVNKECPGGKGFVLEGPAGLSVVNERREGWESKLDSSITVYESQDANWSTDEAKTKTAGLLDKYQKDVQYIFCQNDEMGIGAAQAVDAAGLNGQVKIITIDGTKPNLEALRDGDLALVIEYNPLFGDKAVEVADKALAGEEVEKDYVIESQVFTADKVAGDEGEKLIEARPY